MTVVVKPYLFLCGVLGFREKKISLAEGALVKDLLAVLRVQYGLPERISFGRADLVFFDGEHPVGLQILINGASIKQQQGIMTPLRDGMVVALFPPAAGG
ncbi:MAG TPA: molybdopterin synthase sulfur carrier subunit [Firmicutes bacterium]|nr:molybdopterin synthase sulfur carrier subunit [Bacillota bacterium]